MIYPFTFGLPRELHCQVSECGDGQSLWPQGISNVIPPDPDGEKTYISIEKD